MARLSDNQIRDITRLLEEGKPLPDKYRFLLFGDDREIELVWNGKSHDVTNIVLPFQTIEHVDEPRSEEDVKAQPDLFDLASGRQLKGWTNKLIWGDNKFILSSLKSGPLRDEIEMNGGIKLIYIDPPFDVGADFTFDVEIGEEKFEKEPNVLEEIAYRDTWGKGSDSFLVYLFERLRLMKDLMSPDGAIFVHCDARLVSEIKQILDELFGKELQLSLITWKRTSAHSDSKNFGDISDFILVYGKSSESGLKTLFEPYDKEYLKRFRHSDKNGRVWTDGPLTASGLTGGGYNYEYKGISGFWRCPKTTMERLDREDKLYFTSGNSIRIKKYLDELKGIPVQNIWTDIYPVNSQAKEKVGYPTQKPETLIERVINAGSNPGDLICDFFVGQAPQQQ